MNIIYPLLQRILLVVVVLTGVTQGVQAAEGGISLSRTRVIFLSTDKAQTLTMQNHSSRPYLVQSAVISSPQERGAAPFLTTPPLFRLEGNSKNTIRILRKNDAVMPSDRESVFYFTAIAVPAMEQPKEADNTSMAARVSVGIQNTIKLFYRPAGLTMQSEEAEGRLTFHFRGGEVQVQNPTPYYLTFSRLAFDGVEVNVRDSESMIAPYSQLSYPVSAPVRKVEWSVINDYGGNSPLYKATVAKEGK